MQIFNKIEHQNAPCCVAVGCFDGIHIGHQKIISDMCTYAKENNLVSTVFTFPKSPAVLLGRTPERAIMTQSDKMKTLESLGVEKCFSIDFLAIRNTSAEEYIENILLENLCAKAVFCGFNYRFGKQARGDSEFLHDICNNFDVETFISSPICYGDSVVSSSRIRTLIENGEISTANKLLGKPFSVEQTIVEGKHNGRTVGIPTVNQNLPPEFVTPRFGAYASFAVVDGTRFEAITNVGTRPTVGGVNKNIETHILGDFSGNLYGKTVRTELLYFMRDERKFDNLTELSEQIKRDIKLIYEHNIYQKYFGK